MDPGLIKLLEDDEEDESGPPVSGAAVDAYTERLKGVLGDGGTGAAAAAYGLARAGNGSLKPIPSPAPVQGPTASSVPPATGKPSSASTATPSVAKAIAAPVQITQAQWNKLTAQQQQVYRQQFLHRQQLQQQAQRQAQQQQQQQQQQQAGAQQQAAGAGGAGAQAQRRPASISQGISFTALMPLLQPHLPAEQSERLSALYQRFKKNEIMREDFVRGAKVIVGDQVLVQTIRQMYQKGLNPNPDNVSESILQAPAAIAQQGGSQQPAGSQHSGSSSQGTGAQQAGASSQAAVPSGPSTQAPESQSAHATAERTPGVASGVAAQAQSLQQQQQQQQGQSQAGLGSTGGQQSKLEGEPQGSSQASQAKPAGSAQGAGAARQGAGNLNAAEQSAQGGEATGGAASGASGVVQQVKSEAEKAAGPGVAARPVQMPGSSPFGGFQGRPPTLATPQTVGGGQMHPGLPAQVPRVGTAMQFGAAAQGGQARPGLSQGMSESSQQSEQKPALTKYARAKQRKEQRKAEEERMRKVQEEERLRRQQGGGATVGGSQGQTAGQMAQPLSMAMAVPQPHPKLLEGKQLVVPGIPVVKQEAVGDAQGGGGAQRGPGAGVQAGQAGMRGGGQGDGGETAGAQATPAKEANVGGGGGGEKSQMSTPQAASTMVRYAGAAGAGAGSHPIGGGAAAGGSSTPKGGGAVRQGPPYVLASEVRSPAMNFSTGMAAAGSKDATGGGGQGGGGGVKTPVKKGGVGVGQKKPGEAMPAASQPANKKQKTQGADPDQSIDALNDVTAVSGVNLREEEEQLLAGPKEESRTTEAMRKFVQEEEERLFLEKGPLRTKVQAIAAKCGLSLSDDMERCLSLACEERLRSMLYKLIKYSKQRCDVEKDVHGIVVGLDPRRQVLLMKRRAKEAMEKKQAAENERLRKLNEKKDKGALGDGDNEDLRLKAQKAQQEEDDKMRAKAANVAARAAVGATDMLSKWQMMAAQGLAKRQGGDAASESARGGSGDEASGSREQEAGHENGDAGKAAGSGRMDTDGDGAPGGAVGGRAAGPGASSGRGGTMRRIGIGQGGRQPRSTTMKDVIALLEREPMMSKSSFLYRLYERRDRKAESSKRS